MIVFILLLALFGAWLFWLQSAPKRPAPADDADLWYDDVTDEAPAPQPAPAFAWAKLYYIEPIVDLAWACGYSQQEIDEMARGGRVYVYRNGVEAEFQHYGHYDAKGVRLWECFSFNPEADTSSADRWRRQPTDTERTQALWRAK